MKALQTLLLLTLVLFLLPAGCKWFDNGGDPDPTKQTLISYQKLTALAIDQSVLDLLLSAYPPFNDQVVQNLTKYSVNVYKVIYKTTYKGVEKRASGACLVPDAGETALPLASYQHGTIFADAEAPSSFVNIWNMPLEIAFNMVFASCGFICSSPDYIGYNESGDVLHPYHHFESTAAVCIDMLRAVKEMCRELKIPFQDKQFLFGYSEGGYATLATLKKIQSHYSGEFTVAACCAGAGAYDLPGTANHYLNRAVLPSPAFAVFLFIAYNDVYGWNRPLGELFQSPYSDRIAGGLYNGSQTGSQINAQLTDQTAALFQPAFLSAFRGNGEQTAKNALLENSLYAGWIPQAPTRLYHGTDDDIVPTFNSVNASQAFHNSGATSVEYFPLTGMNHSTAIVPWVKELIVWFKSF